MTASNLNKIVKSGKETKLAYATTAERYWNDAEADYKFIIRHHDNVIAVIGHDRISLSNAGWDSRTTSDRLNRICADNEMPFSVSCRMGDTLIYRRVHQTRDLIASFAYNRWYSFSRTVTSWECVK
jgi:hypothetical protein